jgi:hypothetical protein
VATRDFIVRELHHMLPPTVFFLISFNVIVLTVALIADGTAASLPGHATASLAALVCGKAVLIADALPFFNRYPEKPLIWNTAWKAALYLAVTLIIRLAERLISAATGDYGFASGLEHEIAVFEWPRFWAIQLWLAILFVGYAGSGELSRVIGRSRIVKMFFGPLAARSPEAGAA